MLTVARLATKRSAEEMEAAAINGVLDYGEDEPGSPNKLRAIRPDEVYSASELKKIIDYAEPEFERALFMTGIFCGLRHGEINGLRWPVVEFKKARLFVSRSLTQLKGGSVLEQPKTTNAYRYIKLPPELVHELREWRMKSPDKNGLVFVNELGRPMTRKINNRLLAACCKRAEVRVLSMNNLRHSFASQHLIAGTPVLEVSKLMGHSTPDVTLRIYSRWCEREQSKSELALAGRIFGAVEPRAETGSE
jgi:integrase